MRFRVIPFLFFLFVSCEGVSAQSGLTPQDQAEDIIHDVFAAYDARMAGINNYTVLVKNELQGPIPAIEYYERVDGEFTIFRLVPPGELLSRQTAGNDLPTAQQMAGSIAGAMDAIGRELGIDVSDQSEQVRSIVDGVPDGGDSGYETFDILNIVAERATSVRELSSPVTINGIPMDRTIIVADVSNIEEFEGLAATLSVEIAGDNYVTAWTVYVDEQGGPSIDTTIKELNLAFGGVATISEPVCIVYTAINVSGIPDIQFVTMKLFTDVNMGPPTEQRKAELLDERSEYFESVCPG